MARISRLANDLRCAGLLAHRGYATQACTIAASMYEVAYTTAFIGSDDGLAQRWAEHDDPIHTPWSLWDIVLEALGKIGAFNPEDQRIVEYRVYSQLCMAKHANPLLQMQHSFRERRQGIVSPLVGPDDLEAVRAAQYCMEHAGALAFVAAVSLFREHLTTRLPEEVGNDLVKKIEELGKARKSLEAKAKARWGTKDPFPGKWRK